MKEYSEHEIAMMTNWSELRESKDVTLQQIAQLTNIPEKKLALMEAHDFSVLGTETFATGYLKSYAKMLGVDSAVFIQVYRDALNLNEPLLDTQTQSLPVVGPLAPLVKKINILHLSIGVIVIWFVTMVFMGSDDSEVSVSSEPAKRELSSQPREKYEDSIILVGSNSNVSGLDTSDLAKITGSQSEGSPEDLVQADFGDASTSNDSSAASSEGTEEDLLVFSFSGECWLEIKDASGSVLIAELQQKGDNQRIFGQAPFEVMLGNSRVVTLALNGEVISIEPKSGKKTLRFTVRR